MLLLWAALASLLFAAPRAHAQEATALDQFDPAPAGDPFFWAPSASVRGELGLRGATLLSYAHRPLALKTDAGDVRHELVDHQLILHAMLGVVAFSRFSVDLDLPVILSQGGDEGGLAGFVGPDSSAAVGDLRAMGRVALFAQDGLIPAAALTLGVWLPTGSSGAYAGSESARVAPGVVVGAEAERFRWSVSASRRIETSDGSLLGSNVALAGAFHLVFAPIAFGPEVQVSTITDGDAAIFGAQNTHIEALLSARAALGPIALSAAGGPGFGAQPGTPDFRLLFGVSTNVTVFPEVDRDAARASATQGGGTSSPARSDGGTSDGPRAGTPVPPAPPPPDGDHDGVADTADACPTVAGVYRGDPKVDGCPLDTDGDTIADAADACPAIAGTPSTDPTRNGCPELSARTNDRLVIFKPILFKTGSAELLAESSPTLETIANILKSDPTLARVAVDGHTDSKGSAAANTLLSQRRALAVQAWLIESGVASKRLEARGFGPKQPIADNGTAEGREKNRRVEFVILHVEPEGEARWIEGSFADEKLAPPAPPAPPAGGKK